LHFQDHEGMIQSIISIVCKEVPMGRITEYYCATSFQDAYAKAKQLGSSAAYVGGGVELVLRRNPEISVLIDLSRCGLDHIGTTHAGLEIGSQTTLSTVSRSVDVKGYAGGSLAYWTGHVAHNNLRDMITIGGVIGRNQPWNDIVPHLAALGASVTLYDGSDHEVLLVDYIKAKQPGVLIKGITLPAANSSSFGFLWRFTRTLQDISLLHFSALVKSDSDTISAATIVYAGRPGSTAVYSQLGAELVGKKLTYDTFAAEAELASKVVEVGDDLRASGEFRRELVKAAVVSLGEQLTGVTQ
jgi:CO/xanthine dehydrogenase FAD-binding subunit